MNIISKRTLVQFYEKHPQAKTPLEVWHQDVKKVVYKDYCMHWEILINQYKKNINYVKKFLK